MIERCANTRDWNCFKMPRRRCLIRIHILKKCPCQLQLLRNRKQWSEFLKLDFDWRRKLVFLLRSASYSAAWLNPQGPQPTESEAAKITFEDNTHRFLRLKKGSYTMNIFRLAKQSMLSYQYLSCEAGISWTPEFVPAARQYKDAYRIQLFTSM